ncbi:MAG TPA: hypothetical protein VHJ78_13895, partial [Actinomycetota bacterium]|nr:hypothetical protein [Actinomycetota bacterium]
MTASTSRLEAGRPGDAEPSEPPEASIEPPEARGRLARLTASPGFAYGSILALQLRVLWEFWSGRDLTAGDTSGYFTVARAWAESLHNVFFWSPLYTAYYGTILKVTGDPVSATLVHRLILAFGLTALVLALARRLLPAAAAWLVAAWWAVLPVNFDTLYEVHLFGAIPALVAALAVCRWPGHAGRAAALAVLGTSAVLVRNEYGFAALLFALVCLWSLVREVRRLRSLRAGVPLLRPYVAAGLAATLAIGFFYSRSTVKFPILADIFNQLRT